MWPRNEFIPGQEVRTIVPVWHGYTRPECGAEVADHVVRIATLVRPGTRGQVTRVAPGVAGEPHSLWLTTDNGPINVWPWEIVKVEGD